MTGELTGRMERYSRHGVHMRLSNILDHYRDIEIPCANGLIIGCGDKSSVFVNESDSIDRSKMLIILLGDLA